MNSRTEPARVPELDRAAVLSEVREVTRPCLVVPPRHDVERRTEVVSRMLRALVEETRADDREAVRVMRRLGTGLLEESPSREASPFTAWQYLVNLARTLGAFLDVEGRAR